jgi:type IV fimbrial biogenesis protein FimT
MKQAGLSLVELLVTLAVAAVLTGMVVPAFRDLAADRRGSAALNQIVGAVQYARSAAITHHATVTLCPGIDRRCLGRDQWHRGALLFLDRNGNGSLEATDPVLGRLPSLNAEGRIYWRSFRHRAYLQFTARGYTAWQNGNFLYCPAGGAATGARMVILNPQGRSRVARDRNGDGIMEDAAGRPISCPA